MAIIYSYPEIPDVQGGDLLLISDTGAPNKPTRSVDIDDLAAYIGTVIGIGFWNLGTAPDSIFTTKMASIGQDANIGNSKLNVYKTDGMTASVPHIATFNESSSNHSANLWPSSGNNQADIYGSVSRGTFTGSGTVDQIIGSNPIGRHSGSGSVNFIQGSQATASLTGSGSTKTMVASYANAFVEGTGSNNIETAIGAWNTVVLNGLNDVDNIFGTYSNLVLTKGDVNDDAIGHYINFQQVAADTEINNAYYIHAKNDSLSVTGEKFFIKDETGIPSQFSNKLVLNAYGSGTFTGTATQRLAVDTNGNVIEIPVGSGPVDGSGTANYTARWTDSDTLGIGALYDNGTNIGIGTTSPAQKLSVVTNASAVAYFRNTGAGSGLEVRTDSAAANLYILALFSGSSYKFWFSRQGNLGIGTANPTKKLHVNGEAFFQNTVSLPDNAYVGLGSSFDFHLSHNGSSSSITNSTGNLNISSNGGDAVFNTASTERLRITSSGNVGIGTTSPAQKLTVLGLGSFGTSTSQTLVDYDGLNAVGNTDYIRFKVDNSEKLRIKSNGNVGIGTTSPSTKLEVAGGISLSGNISASVGDLALLSSSGEYFLYGATNGQVALYHNGSKKFETSNTGVSVTGALKATSGGNIALGSVSSIARIQSDGSGGLKMLSSGDALIGTFTSSSAIFPGNVGIGTTSPSAKLHLSDSASGGNPSFILQDNARSGAAALNYILLTDSLNANQAKIGYLSGLNTDLTLQNLVGNTSLVSSGQIKVTAGTNTIFENSGSEKMRILANGNVGIGTTTPGANLHVKTGSNTTVLIEGNQNTRFASLQLKNASQIWVPRLEGTTLDFVIRDDTAASEPFRIKPAASTGSNDSAIIIDGNANVGIGTTSPGAKLSVNGNVKIEGTNSLLFGGSATVPIWAISSNGSDLLIDDQASNIGSVLFNNNEGVALPRLTTTQINAISSPAQGLMAYNTTLNTICFYNGSSWQKVNHANM